VEAAAFFVRLIFFLFEILYCRVYVEAIRVRGVETGFGGFVGCLWVGRGFTFCWKGGFLGLRWIKGLSTLKIGSS
jgi:hypothetical protein